jgi:hypothetical protein
VSKLHSPAKDQLDPDVPAPGEELLNEPTNNGAEDRATDGGKDNKGLV